jgi:hypothetical protein
VSSEDNAEITTPLDCVEHLSRALRRPLVSDPQKAISGRHSRRLRSESQALCPACYDGAAPASSGSPQAGGRSDIGSHRYGVLKDRTSTSPFGDVGGREDGASFFPRGFSFNCGRSLRAAHPGAPRPRSASRFRRRLTPPRARFAFGFDVSITLDHPILAGSGELRNVSRLESR